MVQGWEAGYIWEAFCNSPGKREWRLVPEWTQCGGAKWLDWECILKVGLAGSFDSLIVEWREREGIKADLKVP